jgi:hypothetical protein
MRIILLNRIIDTPHGTFGHLQENCKTICVTLERRWKDNQRNVSCIPEGNYICKRVESEKGTLDEGEHAGMTYLVQEVPDRDNIIFHIGNFLKDTMGCILTGSTFASDMILNSTEAFEDFMDHMKKEEKFILHVMNYGKVYN